MIVLIAINCYVKRCLTNLFTLVTAMKSAAYSFFSAVPYRIRVILTALFVMAGLLPRYTNLDAGILGLEVIGDALPYFDREYRYPVWDPETRSKRADGTTAVTTLGRPPFDDGPVLLLLARERVPIEDKTAEVVVRLDTEEAKPSGALRVRLLDGGGETLLDERITAIPGRDLFFSLKLPEVLAGKDAAVEVKWDNGSASGTALTSLRVTGPEQIPESGSIRLRVPDTAGVEARGVPMTLGVPFPRGVLWDTGNLRLRDADGNEIPMQAKVTAKWARFGSIKWILLDFVAARVRPGQVYYLDYGPGIKRMDGPDMEVSSSEGSSLRLDAGPIRIGAEGLTFGDKLVLKPEALQGAFVTRAADVDYDRRRTTKESHLMSSGTEWEIEEAGPLKTVLRRDGWYKMEDGSRFCKYVVRWVFFRDSPVARLFHTWIYTGDGNRDLIRNMGWRFDLAGSMKPKGFLLSFDEPVWESGDYLLQYDHNQFEVIRKERRGSREIASGGRAPGVFATAGDGVSLCVGVKDFWQNFPSELEFETDAMVVHAWPRHGKPRRHRMQLDDAHRLWFVHEGELLSFQLPVELLEDPLYTDHSRGEPFWTYGRPESANAQGIAKTTEMWLLFSDTDAPEIEGVQLLRGLNDETLRPFVDPDWIAATGAFVDLRPEDRGRFEELDAAYTVQARKPIEMAERMGIYGMWIHGEVLRPVDLDEARLETTHRSFRKAHWGWPYSWKPYARSGDPRFAKFAEAATRMMMDTAYCHYVDDEVAQQFSDLPPRMSWWSYQPFRARGWWNRGLIPWAGYSGPTTRMYADEVEFLWDAYYLTGDARAREVALDWAAETKMEDAELFGRGAITAGFNRARWASNLQKQYLETYQATFDPWFIVAAHALADLNTHRLQEENWEGHVWTTGPIDFYAYTGRQDARDFYTRLVEYHTDWQEQGWAGAPSTLIPPVVYGWELTADPYLLGRAAGLAELLQWTMYSGEGSDWEQGLYLRNRVHHDTIVTSWIQKWYPLLISTLSGAATPVEPIPPAFQHSFHNGEYILVEKPAGQPLPLRLAGNWSIRSPDGSHFDPESAKGASEVILPASASGGIYTIETDARQMTLPVSPPGTREVLVTPSGRFSGSNDLAQYWFLVPDDTDELRITFDNSRTPVQDVLQIGIWNPDGQRVWTHTARRSDEPTVDPVEAIIPVPSEYRGRLWRITKPGTRTPGFQLAPEIPAVLSHSPARWLQP